MTIWWLSYPLLGIFGGFVAGLFGVGGGLTLVPFMYMLFVAQNFPPEHVMHLALGNSGMGHGLNSRRNWPPALLQYAQ